MYTSLVLFALSAAVPAAEMIPVAPSWRSDYTLALKEGQSSKRPLAIVVGSGPEGWDKLSKDGELGKDVTDLLRNRYVCVYLDINNERHRHLAEQLELSKGPALVIGDAGGEYQAFRHAIPSGSSCGRTRRLRPDRPPPRRRRPRRCTIRRPRSTPPRWGRSAGCAVAAREGSLTAPVRRF